jgi:hypothetical protein
MDKSIQRERAEAFRRLQKVRARWSSVASGMCSAVVFERAGFAALATRAPARLQPRYPDGQRSRATRCWPRSRVVRNPPRQRRYRERLRPHPRRSRRPSRRPQGRCDRGQHRGRHPRRSE